jgi:hypothetical protein
MMLPTIPCSDFLHLVVPQCPSCPDPIINHMIRRAAITFCEITKAWRYTGSQVMDTFTETLIAPEHTEIHTIEQAQLGDYELTPVSFFASDPPQITGVFPTGRPTEITQVSPGSVQINPFQTGTLRFSLTLKPMSDRVLGTFPDDPLRDARDTLPAFMLSQHADTLACGALAMILMMSGEPFSDPNKGMLYRQDFLSRCNAAHALSRPGQQRAPRRTKTNWI